MPTLRSFWLLVAVLAGVIGTGLCIHCYQCTSRRNPKCGEPLPGEVKSIECNADAAAATIHEVNYVLKGEPGVIDTGPGTYMKCLKIKSYDSKENATIIRGCYSMRITDLDICDKILGMLNERNNFPSCDICNKDECNGSSRLGSAWLAWLLLPFLAVCHCLRQ